jgi:uncharacterized membrane protein YgdD (TMEM256/DUF423 family)
MDVYARTFLALGAISAGLSVALAALLAHGPLSSESMQPMLRTALSLHQFHALGLVGVALAIAWRGPCRWSLAAGGLMLAGTVLFSFNLYARAWWQFDALRALVPWGGSCWILAWLCLACGALFGRSRSAPG